MGLDGAQADLERALALNPGDSAIQGMYGRLLARVGRLPEAIVAAKKAIELDPLSGWPLDSLGTYLMAGGQFAAARPGDQPGIGAQSGSDPNIL